MNQPDAPLKVHLFSFSYKDRLPGSDLGHGGGFYFDCRCLPNPGREEQYKSQTGLDEAVISYLESIAEVGVFWETSMKLVQQAIDAYSARGFDSLVVGFGCTGGQHRSVYCAERLKAHLLEQGVAVELVHTRANKWPERVG